MHNHTHMVTYTYMHNHTQKHVHTCTIIHTITQTYTCTIMQTFIHTQSHTHTKSHKHVYICNHTPRNTHTYTSTQNSHERVQFHWQYYILHQRPRYLISGSPQLHEKKERKSPIILFKHQKDNSHPFKHCIHAGSLKHDSERKKA